MTTLRAFPRTARRALWFGGLLVVLAGVFGMHGLSQHGADTITPAASRAVQHLSMDHAAEVLHEMAPMAGEAAVTLVGAGGHGSMDMSTGAMCLAFLIGSLLALLLRIRRNHQSTWLFARTRLRPVVVSRARSPDPPSLIALSIQRC